LDEQTANYGPFIRQLWLDALRSGQFRQGAGFLKIRRFEGEPNYCCFGVLAELCSNYNLGPKFTEHVATGASGFVSATSGCELNANPDILHLKLVGFEGDNHWVSLLMSWNDSGVSFGTIAGRIERYFEQHGLGLSEVRP
jgi:hypothetical protein